MLRLDSLPRRCLCQHAPVTTPSGFDFSYTAGTGTANTVVAPGANGNSIIGVQYFTTNAYLLDFTSSLVGWK